MNQTAEVGMTALTPPVKDARSVIGTRRRVHLAIIAILMVVHTLIHYAILLPEIGELVEHVPFFNLHVLHEAEYLGVVAYASLVFRLRGGIIALVATAVASLPAIFAKNLTIEYVEYGFAGPGNTILEVVVLLVIGGFIVFVNEMWGRERDRRLVIMQQLEIANQRLEAANGKLQVTNQQLETANRQLHVLNETIQKQLNNLFGTLQDLTSQETQILGQLPPTPTKDRFAAFVRSVAGIIGQA